MLSNTRILLLNQSRFQPVFGRSLKYSITNYLEIVDKTKTSDETTSYLTKALNNVWVNTIKDYYLLEGSSFKSVNC